MFMSFFKLPLVIASYQLTLHLLTFYKPFTNHTTNHLDFNIRLKMTETPLACFTHLWTNFWIIYMTLLLILVIKLSHTYLKTTSTNILFLILVLILCVFCFDAFLLTTPQHPIRYSELQFNQLLQNKLNRYHPMLLYTSIILLLAPNQRFNNTKGFYLVVSIIMSIATGGWWAYQEGSWGGWWDWDASELLSIFILLVATQQLHYKQISYATYTIYTHNFLLTILFIFTYMLLQAGFAVTLHNFGSIQKDVFVQVDNYVVILIWLIVTMTLLVTGLFDYNRLFNNLVFYKSKPKVQLYDTSYKIILFGCLLILCISFILLFNLGTQTLISLFLSNFFFQSFHEIGTATLVVLLLVYSTQSIWKLFLILNLEVFNLHPNYLLSYSVRGFSLKHSIHFLLVLVFIVSSFYIPEALEVKKLYNYTVEVSATNLSYVNNHLIIYNLDNNYLKESLFVLFDNHTVSNITRSFKLLRDVDYLHKHLHLGNHENYSQYWWSFKNRLNVLKWNSELYFGLLTSLTTLLVLFLYSYLFVKKKITF